MSNNSKFQSSISHSNYELPSTTFDIRIDITEGSKQIEH